MAGKACVTFFCTRCEGTKIGSWFVGWCNARGFAGYEVVHHHCSCQDGGRTVVSADCGPSPLRGFASAAHVEFPAADWRDGDVESLAPVNS